MTSSKFKFPVQYCFLHQSKTSRLDTREGMQVKQSLICSFAVSAAFILPSVAMANADSCDFLSNKIENMSFEYALFLDGEEKGKRIVSRLGIQYAGISANFQYFYNFYTSAYVDLGCDLTRLVEIERKIPALRQSGESLLFQDFYNSETGLYVIDEGIDNSVTLSAFGLTVGGVIENYNQDGKITIFGYKTTAFAGRDESGLFTNFNAAVVPTSKVVAGIYSRSPVYAVEGKCIAAADTLATALQSKYGEQLKGVIDVSTTRRGNLHTWKLDDYIVQLECRSDDIDEMPFLEIKYVNLKLLEEFKSDNLKIVSGQINMEDF